ITTVPDTANISVTDSAGNVYNLIAFNAIGSTGAAIIAACALFTNPLATNQNIIVNSDVQGPFSACGVYYGGAQGSIGCAATTVQNTVTPVISLPRVFPNDSVVALMGVHGPNTDPFTQDGNYSADIGAGFGNNVFALHGGGATVPSDAPPAPDGMAFSYTPTLGVAREALLFMASFK
ncbi:MAG: hypothetical protein HRJ53_11670, partial [Acidobacteria bacterium Pan2503]|nr:hypothetical protein [Candidatus Acidoferrum panamensis]